MGPVSSPVLYLILILCVLSSLSIIIIEREGEYHTCSTSLRIVILKYCTIQRCVWPETHGSLTCTR